MRRLDAIVPPDIRPPGRRQLLLAGGHLAALWAITFALPLLDLLGKNPDFFIARGNSVGDILILALGFTLGPPLALLAVEVVAARVGPRAWAWTHLCFITLISAFLFVQVLERLFSRPAGLIIVIALALGAAFAFAALRVTFVRNLLDILIVAPVVVLAMFVFLSETSHLIFPGKEKVSLGASTASETPVVMIVFDELPTASLVDPEGRIYDDRFPNFARLQREATWYPNFTTTSYFTPTALPGLLTGNRPAEGALATSADQPENVFSLLADSYRLYAIEPITSLCPTSLCPEITRPTRQLRRLQFLYSDLRYVLGRLVLPPGIAKTLPDVGTNFEDFDGASDDPRERVGALLEKARGGGKATDEFSKYIESFPATRSTFTMLHIKQPHQPWKYSVDGRLYEETPLDQLSEDTDRWQVDGNGVATTQQRHLVQAGFADTLLGQAIDRMEAEGIWEDAMVVVTADHGVSFQGGDVPQRKAGTESMGSNANPPLLIRYPGQRTGRTDPRHTMTLDVVPTIARVLEVEGMYETDGFPLQGRLPQRDVMVEDVQENEYSVRMPELIAQRNQAVDTLAHRFGTGPFYTLGPAPRLVGTREPRDPAPAAGASASLDGPEKWDDWDPTTEKVPMFVTGTLEGTVPGSLIAVGVNGRIEGTTRSFEYEGAQRFGTLVDPSRIVRGGNDVNVYLSGAGRRLELLGGNDG